MHYIVISIPFLTQKLRMHCHTNQFYFFYVTTKQFHRPSRCSIQLHSNSTKTFFFFAFSFLQFTSLAAENSLTIIQQSLPFFHIIFSFFFGFCQLCRHQQIYSNERRDAALVTTNPGHTKNKEAAKEKEWNWNALSFV